MRERLLALAERRARLVARAQQERETIAALLAPTDAMSSLVAMLLGAARGAAGQAARYPLFASTGVALLMALRPRTAARWLARGWSLWRIYRLARGWWQRFSANAGAPAGTPR